MKKLYLVFIFTLLLGLFSMPAGAADVKFFGDYYVIGQWTSNYSLNDGSGTAAQQADNGGRGTFGQRLRVGTVFQITEGLKLTTRFDALERVWGQEAAVGTPNPATTTAGTGGFQDENNISWERAFVTFNLGPGFFDVGYQAVNYWSPIAFGNTSASSGGMIRYTAPIGPLTLSAYWQKGLEREFDPTIYKPSDWDRYALQGIYKWKSGQAGLQLLWEHYESSVAETFDIWNTQVAVPFPATMNYYEISPYVQAKLGPVDLEGKLYWTTGKFESKVAGTSDVDIDGLSAYLNGKVNIGPAYVGVMFAYIKGDDPNDGDRTVSHGGGRDWDPTLMLGNDKFAKWQGGRYKSTIGWGTPSGGVKFRGGWSEENLVLYQGYAGYNPIPKLALRASFSYMKQDETPNGYVDDHIGNEFDITASYKIYPNLTYMVGFGYFWAGDWFKGTNASFQIDDCYLLMHQLTMTF